MHNPKALTLSTPVFFMRVDKVPDDEGYDSETEVNIFGQDEDENEIPVMCKWVNVHGTEVFTAKQMQLNEPVTLTTRYSPLINQTLVAYNAHEYDAALHSGDGLDGEEKTTAIETALEKIRYEIISVDDIENRHVWGCPQNSTKGGGVMSLNSLLKSTFSPIAPAQADVYTGKETTYIVFNYNSLPTDFADDEPQHERYLVQAHLYAARSANTLTKRREMKTAIAAAGFTWPEYENASDKDGQHHVFEFEVMRALGVE